MRKIFLFLCAVFLSSISLNAATITSDGTARLYFNMSAVSWWTAGTNGDGNFAYFYGSSGNKWSAHSVKHSGNDYYVVIPAGTWDHVILTRNNTKTSPSWDNKWNQTGNITLSSSSNYLSKFSADSESVTWGTAIKPTSTASVASSAASVFVGVPANLTASLTSNTDINTIKSVEYSTTTGASITGNTFTATAEGTYTVTATVTYHPNGYPSLTSTATATTTITAAVPAEEVHDVTVSYICGGEGIADATTVLSVGVETSVKITAPEIAKYTFANWTLGADVATTDALTSNEINITTQAGGSDFTLVANYEKAKLTYTVTVPAGTENCYLVGAMNGWDVANPIEMTKQGENVFTTTLEGVATTDEYKYISQKGTWDYADVQEANRTWSANDVVTAWKDPLATNVYLVGNMFDNWDKTPDKEFRKTTKDATTASIVVALDADKDYELKVRRGDDWTSCTSKITNTVTGLQFSSSNGDNCKMKTTVAGEYTFTWTISSSKLDVKYPTLYAVTATANDAAMGTVAGAGEYTHGTEVTLTATPDEGYEFVNWTVAGEEVADEATYTFVVEANVELVANFKKHETTIHCVPEGDLAYYVSQAHAGDTLLLADGTYDEAYSITFDKEGLVVMAAEGAKPVIALTGEWTALNVSASTTFDGITFDGTNVAKYIIATLDSTAMTTDLTIENCEFKNWEYWAISNQGKANVSVASVVIDNCLFHDGKGSAVRFGESAPEGKHGCEYFKMTNSTLYNIVSTEYAGIVQISSNGEAEGDVNTVIIDHITLYNFDAQQLGAISIRKTNNMTITNSIIATPEDKGQRGLYVYNGKVDNTLYFNASARSGNTVYTNCLNVDPLFVDAANGNFALMPLSPARGAATDESDLGDPRWYTSVTKYTVTATANPAEAGTVTGAGEYTEGKEVTLVATPAHGYNFVNWTKGEEVVAETAEYTFTASANVELVANFEEKAFAGNIINVEPGEGTLATAVENAEAGDKLVLADGTYELGYISGGLLLDKEGLTITAAENAKPVILYTDGGACLQVVASTTFEGITFDGGEETKASFLITTYGAEVEEIVVYNCEFKNYSNFAISDQWSKGCHIGSLKVDNCLFHDGGQAIVFSKNGFNSKHPCDYFEIKNSTAYNITHNEYKSVIHICSLGDATGAQNTVVIDHVTIWNYDLINGNAAIEVRKTNNLTITNCIIGNPETKKAATYLYGGSVSNMIHFNASLDSDSENTYCSNTDPLFVDAANGNLNLLEGSPAIGAATDGSNLGDPRWVVAPAAPVTYTVAATAENGTVTGAGTYEHGATATLTATPAFDYQFVKWSNESTENPLTITVEDNIELQAIFAEVAATEKKESGVFSISAHKTATFATGNLQYNVGTQTWRFAKQQYQVVGEQNINLGDPAFTGWIDMLGWSNGETNNYGVNPSNKNEYYAGEFVDWGTKMGEGWSTLSAEEWSYLLNTRENAASLKQTAKVDTIIGLLLFPDNWTLPEGCVPTSELNHDPEDGEETKYDFTSQNYTLEQWTKLEQAGAIFLPAAGRRTGGYGNMINYDQQVETREDYLVNGGFYRWQDNTNIYCYYWTSTINEDKNVSYLHNVLALGNNEYTIGNGAIWGEKGRYGQSVRLAKVAYDKHTVTATAENGTVEGAGTYEHGEEVTLTATPAFDYQFVKWSNESTENPLTITVEDNIELQAIFAEVAATEKKESGVFSISAHKTATFATGNLQYNVGTQTWRFAKQQYQVVGEQNINLGDPAFTGWIDMLGWSNGETNNYGVNPSNKNEYYAGEFVDWGTKMGEGWSTLSAEEWSYLLNTRENAASLKQTAKVDTILGILLFPDGWVMPEDVVVEAEMDEYFEVNIYNYTLEQWTKLEQAGAIFLPAAGRRTGGYGNMINYDQQVETREDYLVNGGFYRWQDNTNIYCYYWTSTINEDKNVSYLHNVLALGNNEYTIGNGAIWGEKGRYGQSVRLAKVAYDKHTVTATAENGTVTGAGEYTHGTEITLTATPANEHYVFVNWTKGEEVVAETAEYTFTVEADVELVANFKLDSHTITATAENGTVEGAGTYEHGAEVTLTATANEGYEFVKWSNESTENPLTITVTEDVTISAIFQEVIPVITYTVKWYTAVGETTEVTLEKGADITKPATDPEMEGYVFMGWTDECFVAEDGSDFTAIEDFGTADADKEYYAVFAVETTTDGGVTETLTGNSLSYEGKSGYVEFTATTTSGTWSGKACYNTKDYIQINKNDNNYHIGSPTFAANIKSIKITTTNSTASSRTFYICSSNSTAKPSSGDLGSHTTTASNEQFTIELTSNVKQFYIYSSGAVYISQIDVTVSGEPTTTYSNYMTTCTPDEYTIEWSVNGEVTESTTVVEGDALVLPEAPAAPDACSDKVFMGWATTATVNAGGTEITFVDETTVPEGDAIYYAVFATEIEEETNETYTKTAIVSIADYATANDWADGTKYENVIIDQNITATATSKGSNTGKYYVNGNNWRLYQSEEDATLTINAAEGVTINNVIVTYSNSNSGVLTFNSNNIQSGTTVEVNAPSVTFGVGNTGTATNGQVRVTQISVNYTFSGTVTSTTYADYSTICVIPEYTVTFDYSVDAGYITVNDVRISEKEVTYEEGTELTVKALTFNDWRFDAWQDEEQYELTTTPEYTFTVTGDVVLNAIFTPEKGAVGTGVENNNVVSSKTMKVIQNGRLMIIREGKTYNAQGQMIE